MRIIIVDNISKGERHNKIWSVHVPNELARWGYETLVFRSDRSISRLPIFAKSAVLSADIVQRVITHIDSDSVNDEDVILFPDARDSIVMPIYELLRSKGLKTKLLGFWRTGVYYSQSHIRNRLTIEESKKFTFYERALAGMYDYNLVPSEIQYNAFWQVIGRRSDKSLYKCNYPYSFMAQAQDDVVKEDIVVYNASVEGEFNEKAFNYIKNALPDFQFYVCQTSNFTEQEYRQLLRRAKVLFNTNESESDPWTIMESMLYGTIPLLPSFPIYDEIFPNITKYNKSLLKPPFLNLMRNEGEIIGTIKEFINNYDKYKEELLIPERESSLENNFSVEDLKNILWEIRKK